MRLISHHDGLLILPDGRILDRLAATSLSDREWETWQHSDNIKGWLAARAIEVEGYTAPEPELQLEGEPEPEE